MNELSAKPEANDTELATTTTKKPTPPGGLFPLDGPPPKSEILLYEGKTGHFSSEHRVFRNRIPVLQLYYKSYLPIDAAKLGGYNCR